MTARRDLEQPAPLAALVPGALVYWWDRRTGGRRLGTIAGEPQAHRRGPATVRVLEGAGEGGDLALYHPSPNAHGVQAFPVDVLRMYQAPPRPADLEPQAAPAGIARRVSTTMPTTTTTTAPPRGQGPEALRLI
jgi:hypothetical protein